MKEIDAEGLRADFLRHELKDEKAFKYAHNMLEDVVEKLASVQRTISHYEGERGMRADIERQKQATFNDMDNRLRIVERLSWIAVGGVVVIGGMLGMFGKQISQIDTSDRYRGADAQRDRQYYERRIEALSRKVDEMEKKGAR